MSLLNPVLTTVTIDRPASKRVGSVKRSTYTLHRSGVVTALHHYPFAAEKHKPFISGSFSLWNSHAKANPEFLRRAFDRYINLVSTSEHK